RPGVDDVRLDPAVRQRSGHLHAEGRRLHHDRGFDRVQNLVPFHRFADVLDVVQAVQPTAGNSRVRVVEAGAEHQTVPRHGALACDMDDLAGDVDALDPGLIPDVDAGLDVRLFRGEEQPLEVVDLLSVYVRDAARAVGDVFELGVNHD